MQFTKIQKSTLDFYNWDFTFFPSTFVLVRFAKFNSLQRLYINPFTLKADNTNDAGFSMATEIIDMRGLVGEVGWKLGTSTVAYGKVSLNQAKVEVKINDAVDGISGTLTEDFSGFGFGAGFRQSLASNMYLFGEWHHIIGSEVTVNMGLFEPGQTHKIKPKLTTGLVGAGSRRARSIRAS